MAEKPKQNIEFPKGWLTLYADAGFKDGTGTYGGWLKSDGPRMTISGQCPAEVDDNNLAELYAICQGMWKGLAKWPNTKGFYIRSDSQAALNVLRNGGNGKKEVTTRLYNAYRKMVDDNNLEINLKWVKSHRNPNSSTKSWINNKVDSLATAARKTNESKLLTFSEFLIESRQASL